MKNYFGTLNSADDHLLRDAILANNYVFHVRCIVAMTLCSPISLITSNFSEIYSAVCDDSLVSNAFQNDGFGKVTMKLIIDSL